jgi:hypothetical protein
MQRMTYMWFIHDTEDNLGLAAVLLRKLSPYVRQLRVRWSTLTNNCSIPSSIVVDIEDAQRCTRVQASLYEAIVLCEVVPIQSTAELVVEQELPAHGETESVERVILDKVVHLCQCSASTDDVVRLVRSCQGAFAVDGASEVETGDVDTSILDLGAARGDLSWGSKHQARACNRSEKRRLHDDERDPMGWKVRFWDAE